MEIVGQLEISIILVKTYAVEQSCPEWNFVTLNVYFKKEKNNNEPRTQEFENRVNPRK